MVITTTKIKFEDEVSYKNTKVTTCCGKMEKCPSITLGKNCDQNSDGYEYGVFLLEDTSVHSYDDYFEDTDYHKITHCPFCGSEIIAQVIKEVDVTQEYQSLSSKRDDLNEERRNTDSKKKESELSEEIRVLDKEINGFYHSDGFNKNN